jgi:DNA-binding MarR family transcriptional regulator
MRHNSECSSTQLLAQPRIRSSALDNDLIHGLAHFRYTLRKFLHFSENAARQCGITPQQHQLMLGIAGFTGRGSATVSELAEFLQERPHSVAGLIERAVQNGLVRRAQDKSDRRVVNVSLTPSGRNILIGLSAMHEEELLRLHKILSPQNALNT